MIWLEMQIPGPSQGKPFSEQGQNDLSQDKRQEMKLDLSKEKTIFLEGTVFFISSGYACHFYER